MAAATKLKLAIRKTMLSWLVLVWTVLGGCTFSMLANGLAIEPASAQTLTTVKSFFLPASTPYAAVIEGSDGNFYGTTYYGGKYGQGTVYRVGPDGSRNTIFSFNGSNGAYPRASLLQTSDGNFYGTTSEDGDGGGGTVFKLTLP